VVDVTSREKVGQRSRRGRRLLDRLWSVEAAACGRGGSSEGVAHDLAHSQLALGCGAGALVTSH